MDPTVYGYSEFENTTVVLDQNTPADGIHVSDINLICDTFIGYIGYDGVDDFGLQSGKKIGSPDNCLATTTTTPSTTTTTPFTTTTTPSTTTTTVCPIVLALGENDPNVERLRDFRDSTLAQSAIGRKIIQIYYNNADSINAALERSPALKAFTQRLLEVIAPMVGRKED